MDTLVKLKVVWEVSRNGTHSFLSANSNVHFEVAQGKETERAPRLQWGWSQCCHIWRCDGHSPLALRSVVSLASLCFVLWNLFKGDLQLLVFDIFPFVSLCYLSLNYCVPCFTDIQILTSVYLSFSPYRDYCWKLFFLIT